MFLVNEQGKENKIEKWHSGKELNQTTQVRHRNNCLKWELQF